MLSSLFLSQPLLILKTTHNSQESYPVTLFVSSFSFLKFSKVSTKHLNKVTSTEFQRALTSLTSTETVLAFN